jgi:serine/threonine protein kinase
MADLRRCSVCGTELPPGTPGGHCPKCLLGFAGPEAREEAVLDAALKLPAEQREDYLQAACAGDEQLRAQVEALLQVSGTSAGPFKTMKVAVSTLPLSHGLMEKPGDRIGRYKLLQQIGEGGCGVVYMADQEEPVKRRVALKVIKPGTDTKEVLGRFEAERQALALMDHPNIAKVLEAGATETGRPFFVMELVRGIPITRYCDENKLPTKQRLALFVQVCQAIQHAHQKGIIHRDIKPSNILVADHDGVPVPKIIDFGIAKATAGQTLTDKTVFTALEQFIGTPAYMSPEQAKLSGMDIDTRSDIYSLGVLLYELLTGKTPFEGKRLREAGLDEIRRIIREEEPVRPSQKLSTLAAEEQTTTARSRQTDSPRLIHLVRGDLDWIVMKCLEKDRNRRYETANGLAFDILRHVNNEPVNARPPSQLYRFQKMVRRNKLVFAATGAVALSLIAGLGFSTWSFLREREALSGEQRLRIQAESAVKAAQASERRAIAAEARETLMREQAEVEAVGAFGLLARTRNLGRDLIETLDPKIQKTLDPDPVAVEMTDGPVIRPIVSSNGNTMRGGVSISAGYVYLISQLAHAKAIDRIQPGYFEQYAINLGRETGSNSLPGLLNIFDDRYRTDAVMNDQTSIFNQLMGMTLALNLSHHYLGHFNEYSNQMSAGKLEPINNLLTPPEWDASVKAATLNTLNCALGTDGAAALFEAMDKMPQRPAWAAFIVPPEADLKRLNAQLKKYEEDFFRGVLK